MPWRCASAGTRATVTELEQRVAERLGERDAARLHTLLRSAGEALGRS
jgi:hypothetical protein